MTDEQKQNAEMAILIGRMHGSLLMLPQLIPAHNKSAHKAIEGLLIYLSHSVNRILGDVTKEKK